MFQQQQQHHRCVTITIIFILVVPLLLFIWRWFSSSRVSSVTTWNIAPQGNGWVDVGN